MSIWRHTRRSLGFYVEAGVFCLIIFFIFFICQQSKPLEDRIFNSSQYLFSNRISSLEISNLNIVGGSYVQSSAPPFLVSGESLASLEYFENSGGTIEDYIVEKGDTPRKIADKFDVSLDTILWANNLSSNSTISSGDKLVVLPVSGVLHVVSPGDTLSGLAELYGIKMDEIFEINSLSDPGDIIAGDFLIIPGAEKPKRMNNFVQVPLSGNYFICPIPSPCRITQGLHWYNAIDFSNGSCGEPIYAAAGGTVQRTGYGNVSGRYVRLIHPNGVVTFYGHLSKISVVPGQQVYQGQILGYLGYSGHTIPAGPAGCHLHFDVRFASNPFAVYAVGTELGR